MKKPLTPSLLVYSGSLDGNPAFLGYFFFVISNLSISTKDLPISVPGNWNLTTSLTFPPNILTAFFACFNSSSISPLLYGINAPPTITYGIQYSLNVERFATALDTQRSNRSLYSAFFA